MQPQDIARRLRVVLKAADAKFQADGWQSPQMAYGHLTNELARIADQIERDEHARGAFQRELCRTKSRLAEIRASGRRP